MTFKISFRRVSSILLIISIFTVFFIVKSEMNMQKNVYDVKGENFYITNVEKKEKSVLLFSKNVAIAPFVIEEDYRPGDIVKVNGIAKNTLSLNENIGYGRYLKSRGCSYLINASNLKIVSQNKNIRTLISDLRFKLMEKIDIIYKDNKQIVRALIIGDRRYITSEERQMFNKAGISHIISISGFHIVLIYSIFFFCTKFFDIRIRYILSLFFTFIYVIMTGMRPPSVRAYLFLFTYILSVILNERYDVFSIGFIIISIYLVTNPFIIYDVGFVLSFLSVFSIVMFFRKIYSLFTKKIKKGVIDDIISLIAVTISAQILTAPYVYYNFKTFSLVSILTNLISVPLISILYPFLLLSILFYNVGFLCDIFSNVANFLIDVFFKSNIFLTGFKYSSLEFENVNLYLVICFYIIVVFSYYVNLQIKIRKNMNI